MLALASACIHDHYECATDSDCDIGTAGRCEVDHFCTQYDTSCALHRRYDKHSDAQSELCFAGTIELVDPCAPGQAPAAADDPCGAKVCQTLDACCSTGWSEACVLEAQQVCAIQCDTRIAITATRGSDTALWDLRYDGSAYSASAITQYDNVLAWVAPVPGTSEPRLASFEGSAALVLSTPSSTIDVSVDPTRTYHDVGTLDFDRDLRDTLVLEYESATLDQLVEITKLDGSASSSRDFDVGVSNRGAWGDADHDAFPDGASGTGAKYAYLDNIEDADHDRELDSPTSSSFNGSAHAGFTSLRSLEWRDVNADGVLDLAAFGNSIRLHDGFPTLTDVASLSIDCEPPVVLPDPLDCDESLANFVGTVVPKPTGAVIYAGNTQARTFYLVTPQDSAMTATITALQVPALVPVGVTAQAVFTRDLDGDGTLDIVVIDSQLGVWTSLSSVEPTGTHFVYSHPINSVIPTFSNVHVSVSGTLR